MSEPLNPIRRTFANLMRRAADRREAETQLQLAFEQAAIPMALVDFDGRMIYANESLCELLGRPPERILGASFQEFAHPDHRGDDLEPLESVLAGKSRANVREQRYLHADGHSIWTEVTVSLVKHPNGRPSHFVAQIRDISERRGYEEELQIMADQDPLTGLRNRRGFQARLNDHMIHIERYGAIGALLMVDLDNFKYHNDTLGHDVGDQLLVAVANRLEARLRASDVIGRHGGDEFVVLLPDATREQAEIVAAKLIEQVRTSVPATGVELVKPIGASVGIVCFEQVGPLPVDSAMVYADRAMYQAKHAGRDRFAVYDPETGGAEAINVFARGSVTTPSQTTPSIS